MINGDNSKISFNSCYSRIDKMEKQLKQLSEESEKMKKMLEENRKMLRINKKMLEENHKKLEENRKLLEENQKRSEENKKLLEELVKLLNDIDKPNNNSNEILEEIEIDEKIANNINIENNKCIICLNNYMIHDKISYLSCLHLFHSRCIKEWLKISKKCPLCKTSMYYSY